MGMSMVVTDIGSLIFQRSIHADICRKLRIAAGLGIALHLCVTGVGHFRRLMGDTARNVKNQLTAIVGDGVAIFKTLSAAQAAQKIHADICRKLRMLSAAQAAQKKFKTATSIFAVLSAAQAAQKSSPLSLGEPWVLSAAQAAQKHAPFTS